MIFKRWFKPKWQHENAVVRQMAIADLHHDTPAQKEILHELAFNDAAEPVRKAALERLDEFSLWWQASKHESAERLRQYAEQQLVQMLLQNRVSAQLKQQFIIECHRSSVLESLALAETDATLKLSLLQRLDRQDLYLQALQDSTLSSSQKISLLTAVQDDKALEKLGKSQDTELNLAIAALLEQRQINKEKPIKLKKQLVLFLAKFNALREKSTAIELQQQLVEYQSQWQLLETELDCLADAADYRQKYQKIVELTQAWLAPRLAEAKALIEQQQLEAQQSKNHHQFEQQLKLLSQQLLQYLADGQLDDAAAEQSALDALVNQIKDANLHNAQRQQLIKLSQSLQQQLDRLPEISEQLAQTARLLAELTAQALPDEAHLVAAYAGFKQWQQQWQKQTKNIRQYLPEQFSTGYQQLVSQWQQHCEPMLQQQQKTLRQIKSKLAEFKRLHQAGKYNVLFGLHKGIAQDVTSLAPALLTEIDKELQTVNAQIADLAELQAYIATPRKQQLVSEMEQLITDDSYAIPEKARLIRQAREQWNILGKAEATVDEALNQAFNQACELAFAPCRSYFAEQDEKRAAAAVAKQQVIAGLQALDLASLSGKTLDQTLQQALKSWEQAGVVEKAIYAELQSQFQPLIQQLKQQQQFEQQQNIAKKQQLVAQAAALLTQPIDDNSLQLVKQLQQQWKNTGFAGRKLDQALWSEFRQHCDQLFAERGNAREQAAASLAEQRLTLLQQFEQLSDNLQAAETDQALQQVAAQLDLLNTATDKELQTRQRQLQQQIASKQLQMQGDKQINEYRQLFDFLQQPQPDPELLPAIYRLVFGMQAEQQLSRADLTLAMEWLAGVPSPIAEQSRRQQVQMILLSDKHNSGEECSLPQLLGRWLQYGTVSVDEQPLLSRVRALYLTE